MEFQHITVMQQEVAQYLAAAHGGTFVDGTVGGGGHAAALLSAHPYVQVIGIDRDPHALNAARKRLAPWVNRIRLLRGNFADLEQLLAAVGSPVIDGVVLDLGVSSPQLDQAKRGFSYQLEAPLDMRMDPDQQITAADIVNSAPHEELIRIIRDYGEERWAVRIAAHIVRARENRRISTTTQLAHLVKEAIPAAARRRGPHPARRTFQALRLAVNDELENLRRGLEAASSVLRAGGRLAVISFHSLEDRMVKSFFRTGEKPCTCPPHLDCVCGNKPSLKVLTSKGVKPSPEEIAANPRSRSATLRVAERVLPAKENE